MYLNCSGNGVGGDSFKSRLFTLLAKAAFRVWESVRELIISLRSTLLRLFCDYLPLFFVLVIVMVQAVLFPLNVVNTGQCDTQWFGVDRVI